MSVPSTRGGIAQNVRITLGSVRTLPRKTTARRPQVEQASARHKDLPKGLDARCSFAIDNDSAPTIKWELLTGMLLSGPTRASSDL